MKYVWFFLEIVCCSACVATASVTTALWLAKSLDQPWAAVATVFLTLAAARVVRHTARGLAAWSDELGI